MLETMTQFVLADHIGGAAFVPPEGEMGYRRLLSRTRGPYPTKDGYLAIVVYTDRHWRDFSKLIGLPDLLETDDRFRSQESRTRFAQEIGALLAQHLPARTNAEWLAALHAVDIPACPVNSIEALFTDPHLTAVKFFEQADHPTEGRVTVSRFPGLQRIARLRPRLAPNLGEHNAEVLGKAFTPPAKN